MLLSFLPCRLRCIRVLLLDLPRRLRCIRTVRADNSGGGWNSSHTEYRDHGDDEELLHGHLPC